MARHYFPNGGAVGGSLKIPEMKNSPPYALSPPAQDPWLRIIGVVADKRDDGLRNPILPEAFIPYTLTEGMWTQILVRSDGSPLALLHAIGKKINSVDADQQIQGNVQDLEQWIRNEPEWQQEHLVAWLFGAFALLGLGLAATGLYSVVSFSVEQRTNEFGIRMALGARRPDVFRTVFSSVFASVGSGFVAGLILTLALNRLLARWAEGSSRDMVVLLSSIALLTVIALLACAAPAQRASSVDPMTALRYE